MQQDFKKIVAVNVFDIDYTDMMIGLGAPVFEGIFMYFLSPESEGGGVIIRTRSFVFVTTLFFETNASSTSSSSSSTLISGFNKLYSTVVSVVLSTGGKLAVLFPRPTSSAPTCSSDWHSVS